MSTDEKTIEIAQTELSRRLMPPGSDPARKPSGAVGKIAAQMRSIWIGADLVGTRKGKRNSIEIRRK